MSVLLTLLSPALFFQGEPAIEYAERYANQTLNCNFAQLDQNDEMVNRAQVRIAYQEDANDISDVVVSDPRDLIGIRRISNNVDASTWLGSREGGDILFDFESDRGLLSQIMLSTEPYNGSDEFIAAWTTVVSSDGSAIFGIGLCTFVSTDRTDK
ncbi:hypothetical protein ERY430_70361 [Erythrobacter sp. EC-HK427]|nr:hypothetical protein ERY430_70361 [Erythrobacter sp. EC-HK427]